jgi:hypothetical protein
MSEPEKKDEIEALIMKANLNSIRTSSGRLRAKPDIQTQAHLT